MRTPLLMVVAVGVLLAACARDAGPETATAGRDARQRAAEGDSPLMGAWELVHGEYTDPAGTTSVQGNEGPFQLKLFTADHFAFVMRNDDGSFSGAGAGTYTLDGTTYRETHHYQSERGFVGYTATWSYRLSGDTLYMEGPTQVRDAAGNDVTAQISRMRETRIRAD